MNALLKLVEHGQSYWIDNLTRRMITSGELECRVRREGLRGVTSNPQIFQKAITGTKDYDEQIENLVGGGRPCPDVREIYEALVTTDIRNACDILRPVYDDTSGLDGYVSLEVSPHLAHYTEASIEQARHLFRLVDRPNLFIKIPGTLAGLPAIEELLFEGINVNITLLFSVERYEAVAEAYLRALERRREAGLPLDEVASVASFFLSRIDVLTDELLRHRITPEVTRRPEPDPKTMLGKSAIANAKLAYQSFKRIIESDRWKALEDKGARVQRMLWASTSTKNPAYSDVMYVEPLIGPNTVNTMPEKTIDAFADHGAVRDTIEEGLDEANAVMNGLAKLGIDFGLVTAQLENEGVQKFIEPYDALMASLADKCQKYSNRRSVDLLQKVARELRRDVVTMTTEAGSGHPTSSLSCADIVAALFFHEMRWDPTDPSARDVDTFVLSKGHAAPILWAALHQSGACHESLTSLRKLGSTFEGHPTPTNPWVKVATGSLGQGLAAANGIALANRLDGIPGRVYCLLGDGECSEGSVWEAAQFASLNKLSGLVAIVDVNGLGQTGPTPYGHRTEVFARRFQSFGWSTIEIDGHDIEALLDALYRARKGGPTAIIAKTEKGRGVSFLEGVHGWHGKALDREAMEKALRELGETGVHMTVEPRRLGQIRRSESEPVPPLKPGYRPGEKVATRKGFGIALEKLGESMPDLVVLDGDVSNSTYTEFFARRYPKRFFQSYIAEQNLVGTALGLAVSGKVPVAATFACFLSRAYDFIRMAGHSRPPHLVLCGSHAGVSIGEDGPSQMGLEDLAMFRALAGSTVLYPCDAVSAERLTELAVKTPGIVYLRTTRPSTPVIYSEAEDFPIGGSKVLRSGGNDRFTVVAAGITVHDALAAHDSLKQRGISVRVIDAYSVKPLDVATLEQAARETQGIVVVEDHWRDGGLGDAVAAALNSTVPVHRLAVSKEPRSGTMEQLLERHGISRRAIEEAILAFG
ncbi:transketolase [Methylocaldum szegediense]|uniref:Transaldolase n=1 Tax=Methylocaldum szegediense TaxID=73780 RepID=A0ABN8WYL6_9GAMM|nr:transketolase [Methylocaldum szegediense]CAI8764245.1 transketolase [Methylocaldum szegediense]